MRPLSQGYDETMKQSNAWKSRSRRYSYNNKHEFEYEEEELHYPLDMLIPPKAPNKTVGYLPVGYWKPPHGYGEKVKSSSAFWWAFWWLFRFQKASFIRCLIITGIQVSYLLMRGAGSSSDILPILLSSVASLASKPG